MFRQSFSLLRQVSSSANRSKSMTSFFARMGSTSSSSPDKPTTFIENTVKDNCVVIFSKTTCGFCRMAKGVFDDIGTPYLAVELNQRGDGREIQETLHKITGGTTVPQVFVNGQCIGGGTETKHLHLSGGLIPLLQQCSTES